MTTKALGMLVAATVVFTLSVARAVIGRGDIMVLAARKRPLTPAT